MFKYILTLIIALQFSACNDVEFAGGSQFAGGSRSHNRARTSDDGTPATKDVEVLDAFALDKPLQELFAGPERKKTSVDIVFAVDQSGSMQHERDQIQNNIVKFSENFKKFATDIDYKIFVMDTGFTIPASLDPSRIIKVMYPVDNHDALSYLWSFVNNHADRRKDATMEAIVVTDDNAGGGNRLNAAGLKYYLATYYSELPFHLHGFVQLQGSSCGVRVGTEYISLGADTKHGGLIQDICAQNWDLMLTQLGQRILSTYVDAVSYTLKTSPDLSRDVKVYFGDQLIASDNYQIDADKKTISFAAGKLPAKSALKIEYFAK